MRSLAAYGGGGAARMALRGQKGFYFVVKWCLVQPAWQIAERTCPGGRFDRRGARLFGRAAVAAFQYSHQTLKEPSSLGLEAYGRTPLKS